jgi:hypothetical protein
MSADGAAPASDSRRIEWLRKKFPWLSAGATIAEDPEVLRVELPPSPRACTGCGVAGHDRRNCPEVERQPKRCAWCREVGHVARLCPARPTDVDPGEASMRARADLCRRCRRLGHRMPECPEKPAPGGRHCGWCKEPGHQIVTCAKFKADRPGVPPPAIKPKRPAQIRCGICREPGHRRETCPLRPVETELVDLVAAPVVADAGAPEDVYDACLAAPAPPAVPVLPPQVRAENEKAAPGQRCCSVCRKPGHRRQTCPQLGGEPKRAPGELSHRRALPPPVFVDRDEEADLTDLVADEPPVDFIEAEAHNDVEESHKSAFDGDFRPFTESPAKMRREIRRALRVIQPDEEPGDLPARPRTRGDCQNNGIRPCPFISCRHNLFLDVDENSGAIKFNYAEVGQMRESCTLDVADRGGITLEAVAQTLNLTRERIRQIEVRGLVGAKESAAALDVEDPPEHRDSPLGGAVAL